MSELHSRLYNHINTHSNLILLIVDADGIITHANSFSNKLAGRQLESTHVIDFFTGFNANLDQDKILNDKLENALLNVNTYSNIPETFYFTSYKTTEGILLIGEFDHDEVKYLRDNMLSINNELSNLTRELQKKNIQLDKLNQLKNQFLGMAAHDLRNPISSIFSFSQFVIESSNYCASDELKRILEMIKKSSEFMLNMLDELLDVVKIESGKLQLDYQVVNAETFLRKNIDINSLLAEKKDIKLVLTIPKRLPELEIDVVKIEQVMNNLISNALKYSHNNTTVTIGAFSTGKELLISVKDQGVGIPQNELDKVFTPFAKISVKGTAGEKSTGLGLSIVKRIVTGHLGRIWVESKVGEGSTFSFTLPLENRQKPNNRQQ